MEATTSEMMQRQSDVSTASLELNAPKYMFESHLVAKEYPHSLESLIVLSYESYLPGEICHKWHGHTSRQLLKEKRDEQSSSAAWSTMLQRPLRWIAAVSAGLSALLQILGAAPMAAQRTVLHIVQPMLLGGLISLGHMATMSTAALVGLIAVTLCFIGSIIYLVWQHYFVQPKANDMMTMKSTAIQPIDDTPAPNAEADVLNVGIDRHARSSGGSSSSRAHSRVHVLDVIKESSASHDSALRRRLSLDERSSKDSIVINNNDGDDDGDDGDEFNSDDIFNVSSGDYSSLRYSSAGDSPPDSDGVSDDHHGADDEDSSSDMSSGAQSGIGHIHVSWDD